MGSQLAFYELIYVANVNLTAKINRMCLTDVILVSYIHTLLYVVPLSVHICSPP